MSDRPLTVICSIHIVESVRLRERVGSQGEFLDGSFVNEVMCCSTVQEGLDVGLFVP